jgi:hypothetical protein
MRSGAGGAVALRFSKLRPLDPRLAGLETLQPWPLSRRVSPPSSQRGPADAFRLPSAYEAARVSSIEIHIDLLQRRTRLVRAELERETPL